MILVVEDNFMLAELTKDLLEDTGCRVVGPVDRLEEGLAHARAERLDGAILDINLHGELSFAIAEVLAAALRDTMRLVVEASGGEPSSLNIAVTDGEAVIATRTCSISEGSVASASPGMEMSTSWKRWKSW